jgi:hypothetical protein
LIVKAKAEPHGSADGGFIMQFSLESSASYRSDDKPEIGSHGNPEDKFVPRRIENLELPCRYSVIYELTRVDYILEGRLA